MKRTSALIVLGVAIIISAGAHAGDYLGSAFEDSLVPSKIVLVYDECVKQGFIEHDGPSAEEGLRAFFNRYRTEKEDFRPNNVTGDQVADAKLKALDLVKSKLAEHPFPVDKEHCEKMEETWPQFANQYGIK